jgi:hypothetical protein
MYEEDTRKWLSGLAEFNLQAKLASLDEVRGVRRVGTCWKSEKNEAC